MRSYLDNYKILGDFKVGFEFEFFSKFKPTRIKELIESNLTNKTVNIVYNVEFDGTKTLGTKIPPDKEPTEDEFYLHRDYSGGSELFELVTGPLGYHESLIVLKQILSFIRLYSSTNERCGLHLNLSFNGESKIDILHMSPLKFCLNFDEEFIYTRFPDRRNNVYASSIKEIYKQNDFSFVTRGNFAQVLNGKNFQFPKTKYYGINFIKLLKNYLEFRYIGGVDYENKETEILEILEYIALNIFDTLYNPKITDNDFDKFISLVPNHNLIQREFYSIERILQRFPDLIITVDLKSNYEILKTYSSKILKMIWKLINNYDITEGHINYDSDVSKFQFIDLEIEKINEISNIELVNCKFQGKGSDLAFWDCEIQESIIIDSKFNSSNLIKDSKIKNCRFDENTEFENTYIENSIDSPIKGNLKKSIIRKGILGNDDELILDDETILIQIREK